MPESPAAPTSAERRSAPSRGLEPAAIVALGALAGVWAWWALKHGAYFGKVMLPGAVLLCLVAALLAGFAPWRGALAFSPPARLALYALTGLGLWTLVSALWSPAPDIAVGDGQRVLVYALAFGLGLWACNLLGPRMKLSLLPLAAAAGLAGLATVAVALTGEPGDVLFGDGTLDYPLGYRNANAAFFAIALFPALGLAAERPLDWRLRALALGTATLCIDLFLLCQSRGAALALLPALVAYALCSPHRLRALSWLALAALPAAGMVPAFTGLYEAAGDVGVREVADELRASGRAAALTTLVAVLLGGLAARNETRLPGLGAADGRSNRAVGLGIAGIAAVGAIGFVAVAGNPVDWAADRADEFTSGTPSTLGESSRFSLNAGSDRYDLWRVAIDDFLDDPLFGDGAGGYEYTYAQKREVDYQNARDAHSVELETAAELGLPGVLLLAAALGGAGAGAWRSQRLGPSAAGLSGIAIAAGTYWLAHASIDWFWPYPALTAPVFALMGAACAPAVFDFSTRGGGRWRAALIAAAVAFTIFAIPPVLAERFIDGAYDDWREDPERAYADLERAGDLNRLSDLPLLAEGAIAREAGDDERAIAAFGAAAEKRPESWAAHYLLAEMLATSEPALARNEARVALELNPLGDQVRRLAGRLGLDAELEATALPEAG